MRFRDEDDKWRGWVEFDTGKVMYCYGNHLSAWDDLEGISYGSDGSFWCHSEWGKSSTELTPGELAEIADYNIDLWKRFKEKWAPK